MRIPMIRTVLAAAFFTVAFCPSATFLQAAEAFKMGVVDPQSVLERSKAGKKELDGLK